MTARPARPVLAALGALLLSLLVVLVPALPAAATPEAEADLLGRINGARVAAGLPAYTMAPDLVTVARGQSQRMAASNTLFHNPDLAKQVPNWSSLGENVGYGGSVPVVHDAFMNSAPHRANLMSGTFTEIGLGVVVAGGRTWVTQVFRKPMAGYTGYAVGGAIGDLWSRLSGVLGAPISGEFDVPGGRAQRFQRGEAYWSAATGAHAIWGGILAKYKAMGGSGGNLGMPTSSEHDVPGGRRNTFSNGQIVWSPGTGAVAVWGGIGERYAGLGSSGGPLGLPTREEADAAGLGRWAAFAGGRIYWSPAAGSKEVYGGILRAYWKSGGSAGPLGYPITGEYDVPGGRRNDFQRGSISWQRATNTTTLTVR